ncbi:unnamed protein product [Linum trigynum]|uniref:non-specific serine/threonine protein kinase n=1 Tax=Linum trigynum TaxID=586398 RepID=A0AAV2G2J2_9ROSI
MNSDLALPSFFIKMSFFGIKLWVLILALASLLTCLILAAALLCIFQLRRRRRNSKLKKLNPCFSSQQHLISWGGGAASSLDRRLLSQRIIPDVEMQTDPRQDCAISIPGVLESDSRPPRRRNARKEGGGFLLRWSEIETATGGFADHNIVGDQDGVIVYLGLLKNARVAIVQLPSKSCQAEKFMAEMDAIGQIRHKNLVHLLGYCVEGDHRAIVMEYVANGNLHQWLHECPKEASSLSWDQRMNILQGVAKGLAYLHEGVEPRIIHGHLKSTSILLDRQWNAKISDLCISKLLSQESHSIALSGYLTPEFDSTCVMMNEQSDVYSFGVLVTEIICGRNPALGSSIEWLKSMIADGKTMSVLDPKLPQMPSSIALKRMLLVALRCVDPEICHRPSMGEVIHMLETSDLLLVRERQIVESVESLDEEQRGSVSESSAGG